MEELTIKLDQNKELFKSVDTSKGLNDSKNYPDSEIQRTPQQANRAHLGKYMAGDPSVRERIRQEMLSQEKTQQEMLSQGKISDQNLLLS